MSAPIDQLIRNGDYAEAAKLARENGDLEQAAKLYERVWDFAAAAACAREAGNTLLALENAILARDESAVEELQQTLASSSEDGPRQVVELLVKHRRYAQAAPLAEQLGSIDDAILYYRKAHLDLDAARLLISTDRDHEAGRILEGIVEIGGDPEVIATAQLQLGNLLSHRLQHEEAIRFLQAATSHNNTRLAALTALVGEFAALGYRNAAQDTLRWARQQNPALPTELDTFLRNQKRPPKRKNHNTTVIAGRYRLGKQLGSGGSGHVFLARDEVADAQLLSSYLQLCKINSNPPMSVSLEKHASPALCNTPTLSTCTMYRSKVASLSWSTWKEDRSLHGLLQTTAPLPSECYSIYSQGWNSPTSAALFIGM